MPVYEFWCGCGHQKGIFRPMMKPPRYPKCPSCKVAMNRSYSVYAGVFKPFTSSDFTGEPIEVSSREQFERLCSEHRVTPDSFNYTSVSPAPPAIESLEYSEVKQALDNCSDEQLESERRTSQIERGRDPFGGEVSTAEIPVKGT